MTANRMLFVNLPVEDLQRSVEFWTTLGFEFDPKFTDENATCMLVGEQASVMLLTRAYFEGFAPKPIGDVAGATTVLLALSAESREEVDRLVRSAIDAGGKPSGDPQDHGFMYQWSFQDPDGHCWEVAWMDPAAMESGPPAA